MTLDTELPEQHIKNVISEIFKDSQPVSEVQIAPGSNVGEGFLGVTAAITVKFFEDIKHFFVKLAPEDPQLRESLFLREAFVREHVFYSKVIPVFKDLYFKYTKEEFDVSPHCEYTSIQEFKECIVLDNLATKQYKVLNSKGCFDKEHLMVTLKTYSRLHACGFILKKENPDLFQELLASSKSNLFAKFGEVYGFHKLGAISLDIIKEHCSLDEDKDILENLENLRTSIFVSLNCLKNAANYCSIIHGDCWKNNLMFKHKNGQTQVEDLKIIDFQMWTVNSPVIDLLHTICINAHSKEVLDNLDHYLDFYHSSLSKTILKMNGNPEELFPREVMYQHWKKYASYGLLFGLNVTRGMVGGPDCLPNIIEYIKANKPLDEAFKFNLPNEREYCERIKVLLRYMIKNRYF